MKVVGYAYPWDVIEPGFLDRARELGVDEVAVAVAYHSARAATPWSRTRTAVHARHAALYRPVRDEAWSRLKPASPDWAHPDSAGQAVALLNEAGIPAAAWLVLTHNSLLGTEFPELTVRNCFGERYPWALCPSQEEVRDYAVTLAEEALAGLGVSSVILEACGQLGVVHQCRHEKTDAVWSPAVARLLSVCCCEACGVGEGFREDVQRLIATGDLTTREDPVLREELLTARHKATDLLRRAVLHKIDKPVALHGDLDPWATGALPGLTPTAAGDAGTVVLPCWQSGVELVRAARARLPSSVEVGAYVTALGAAPDLEAYVGRLRAAGADQLHLYHLGLAGPGRWDEMRGAVAATRAWRKASMETETTELDRILAAAAKAAPQLAGTTPAQRAGWLAAAADALDAAGSELLPLAAEETNLPAAPRLKGELARTTFQLRLFGEVLRDGAFLGATVDHTDPEWPMGPRPDIRRTVVPIGPALVFAASNFPFAFSVAGGDTASALAAGCPVVLKAHPGHPKLSARTGEIVREALIGAGAPDGIFDVIFGVEQGVTALKDPRISAASFTGSIPGGRALFDIAVSRPAPIPFYGELGSVNPVVVTPGAVKARGEQVAKGYVGSFTLGAGQFCTKPGLLFLPEGHGLEAALTDAAKAVGSQPMLNERFGEAFQTGVARLREQPDVTVLASGDPFTPTLLSVRALDFLKADEVLRSECFGPSSIVVTYSGQDELLEVLGELEPGLTATVQAEESEAEDVRKILPVLTRLAGRLLWNDWPTGVTVSWAQQHGGPYPATTAPTTTSVGTAAIERFLRPVAWQGFPDTLLPPPLQEANPWQLPRRVDGKR